jgi:hypothetical protein
MHHGWSTQRNEAMNQSIAKFAPKGRDFSRTGSLHPCRTNTGGMHYFSTVLKKIGCCPPPVVVVLHLPRNFQVVVLVNLPPREAEAEVVPYLYGMQWLLI